MKFLSLWMWVWRRSRRDRAAPSGGVRWVVEPRELARFGGRGTLVIGTSRILLATSAGRGADAEGKREGRP